MVDGRYAVAHFLDRRHIMSGKQVVAPLWLSSNYLLFEVARHSAGSKPEKGLVENHKRRTVYNRADELYH